MSLLTFSAPACGSEEGIVQQSISARLKSMP